ncbi:FAD binding domain-containing protein [Amycolatopsis alkalitolerans]|uniref:Xanthine dehydrogenase family protein subunit M n=1 Tax=Amycolatopsis alkalitolerans TaxID=2547244 RepID=A0A5C4MA18_9PSEU|nr:xanthine dehydrogenase family protein subunit M [Amycolatopsis alkalitolerans]TNC29059.1 xanthine dehydrogenase family protein subunit M [Amycolatopsis alkalitolerans]
MKPGRFTYHAPRSLDEALALLAEHGDESKILAGGQSLMPLLNFRLAQIGHLVDINRIGEEFGTIGEGDTIRLPALVRQRQAERSAALAEALPLLGQALRQVAHPQVRNRGTLCGSLAHADPAAELPTVMSVLDTTFTIASARGIRTVEVADFFQFHLTTALEPDELLLDVRIRRPAPGTVTVFHEFATRRGDFALAAIAAAVRFEGDRVAGCRIAAAGVAPTPRRLTDVEALVTGSSLDTAVLAEARTAARESVEPTGDIHAGSAYRKRLTGVLVHRALADARAQQEAAHA